MVVRTQISLDSEAHRKARQRAGELGVSFAEYVRRLVDADLGEPLRAEIDIDAVFDLGHGGDTDVARGKDRLVGESVAAAVSSGG